MTTRSVKTFTATIWCGLRERYDGVQHAHEDAVAVCQEYVDEVGWCVSVTPTEFVYKHGHEPGAAVGIVNYPRFPSDEAELRRRALELAERLRVRLGQIRVSVVFADGTVMLSAPGAE